MNSNYDEMIRNAFSEKIEVPREYQQRLQATLKQARIASSQKESGSEDIFSRTGSKAKNFCQRHKISVKTCLSLAGGICACLGLIIVLSVFLKQGSPGGDFDNKQYIKISATPTATENTVTADDSLRTEIPADTESPRRTKLPLDTINPTLTVTNTNIPENSEIPKKEQKKNTEVAQTKNSSKPGNSTTANHPKKPAATPKRNKTTRPPELAQAQTSCMPESVETPPETTTPTSIESPEKTKTPENSTPHPKSSEGPDLGTMSPAAAETPAETPMQATPTA